MVPVSNYEDKVSGALLCTHLCGGVAIRGVVPRTSMHMQHVFSFFFPVTSVLGCMIQAHIMK